MAHPVNGRFICCRTCQISFYPTRIITLIKNIISMISLIKNIVLLPPPPLFSLPLCLPSLSTRLEARGKTFIFHHHHCHQRWLFVISTLIDFFVVKIKRTFKSPHSLEYFFPFDVILHLHISILAHIFPHGIQLFKQRIPQKSYSPYSVYRNYIKLEFDFFRIGSRFWVWVMVWVRGWGWVRGVSCGCVGGIFGCFTLIFGWTP